MSDPHAYVKHTEIYRCKTSKTQSINCIRCMYRKRINIEINGCTYERSRLILMIKITVYKRYLLIVNFCIY